MEESKLFIFVGDSLTHEGDWQNLLRMNNIINKGFSGDTTQDILSRIDDIFHSQATHYFIMAGVNDLTKGISADDIVTGIDNIIKILRQCSPQAKMIIQSILPVNNKFIKFSFDVSLIHSINEKLQSFKNEEENIHYLDLFPVFADNNNQLILDYTNDGVHLKKDAYVVWAEQIKSFLRQNNLF